MSMSASSVAAANKAFYAKHPERKGKPITEGEPGYAQLAKSGSTFKSKKRGSRQTRRLTTRRPRRTRGNQPRSALCR